MRLSYFLRISNNSKYVSGAMLIAAGMWGLFWIPLRALGESGFSAVWSTAIFYILPFLMLTPIALYRWKSIVRGGRNLILIGFFLGLSMAFYSYAYFFTDVVRVLLLYYLLPVWGTILARIFLGEPITRPRIITIALGFTGMLVVFGIGDGIPWPRNLGDWMALAAGIIWAVGSLLTKVDTTSNAFDITYCFFLSAVIVTLASLFLPQLGAHSMPSLAQVLEVLPWMAVVSVVLIIPVCLAVIWGAGILSPGRLGVLFMSEISVGIVGAAVLTNEIFGVRELIGVVFITAAGLYEGFLQSDRPKKQPC